MTDADDILYDVIVALAEAEGIPPFRLEYSLAKYVDPDLLETIVSSEMTGELTFQVPGHEVTITATGDIAIDGIPFQSEDYPHPTDPPVPGLSAYSQQISMFFDNFPCTVYQSRNEPGWPIEFISDHCRELTGYDPNAFIVGGVDFGFDLIHPDDRDRVSTMVQHAVKQEQPFSIIYRIETADGTEKWVLEIGVGLFDQLDPITFVGALIDISTLKIALEALPQMEA